MNSDPERQPQDHEQFEIEPPGHVRILGSDGESEHLKAYTPRQSESDWDRHTSRSQRDDSAAVRRTPQTPQHSTVVVKRGPTTCAVLAGIGGLLALSCMLLAFATFRDGLSGFGKLTGLVPGFNLHLATPTVVIDTSRPSVVDRIQALSKLETVHYQIEKVISGSSTGPLPAPLTGDKILLVAHGEVVAGVDLSKVSPQDVDEVGTAVTLTVPPPEILYSKLDNDKTHVYDRQTGIFSKPDPNLESTLRATAEQQIVQAAQEDGILQQARTNAQQTLRTLLEGLGYKDVRFEEGK